MMHAHMRALMCEKPCSCRTHRADCTPYRACASDGLFSGKKRLRGRVPPFPLFGAPSLRLLGPAPLPEAGSVLKMLLHCNKRLI
jgi:hypothetical protein